MPLNRPFYLHVCYLLVLLGVLGRGLLIAQFLPFEVPDNQLDNHPYKFTGLIETNVGTGSGAVAFHPKIVVGCAHVVTHRGSVVTRVKFHRAYHSNSAPAASAGALIAERISPTELRKTELDGQAAGLEQTEKYFREIDPPNPSYLTNAMAGLDRVDYAVHYGYEDMGFGEFALGTNLASAVVLGRSRAPKIFTGYPQSFNPEASSRSMWIMCQTGPFTSPFDYVRYTIGTHQRKSSLMGPIHDSITVIGGNSGGPLWVRDSGGGFRLAGVVTRGSGMTLPLSSPLFSQAIRSASRNVGPIQFQNQGIDTPQGVEIIRLDESGHWSKGFGLGEQDPFDIDSFRLVVSEDADYTIETLGTLDTVGRISSQAFSMADDNSGTARNFRLFSRLAKGSYQIDVRGAYGGIQGNYVLSVQRHTVSTTALASVRAVNNNREIAPGSLPSDASVRFGTDFGRVAKITSPGLNRSYSIRNVGGIPLILGTPRIELVGPHASQFEITSQPDASVQPNATTTFSVRYRPANGVSATHFASVRIHCNDSRFPQFDFGIKGATGAAFTPLAGNVGNSLASAAAVTDWEETAETDIPGVIDYGGDVDFYRFTVTQRALWIISTTGITDTHGALFQVLSRARLKRLAVADNTGSDFNFSIVRVLDPGEYVIAVRGARRDVLGEYTLKFRRGSLDAMAIVIGNRRVPIFDDQTDVSPVFGNDFASVDHRRGRVNRQFFIGNQGYLPLTFTGTPKITITGPDADAFRVTQPRPAEINPGRTLSFTVSFDPSRPGPHEAIVSIPLSGDDTIGESYDFAISGIATGPNMPTLPPFARVFAGGDNGYGLTEDGTLWGWGSNYEGQVGPASQFPDGNSPVYSPTKLTFPPGTQITAVAVGSRHVLALDSSGNVWSWGHSGTPFADEHLDADQRTHKGKLGHGDFVHRDVPTRITALNHVVVKCIDAGEHNSLCVDEQGRVWAWGSNEDGQLGINPGLTWNPEQTYTGTTYLTVPTIVPGLAGITAVKAVTGYSHTLVLDDQGRIWSFGSNESDQLGRSEWDNRHQPGLVNGLNGVPITEIAAGRGTSFAIDQQGRLWSWGSWYWDAIGHDPNDDFSFPVPTLVQGLLGHFVTEIRVGNQSHVLIRDLEGAIWGFCRADHFFYSNQHGELGRNGPGSNVPIRVSSFPAHAIGIAAGHVFSLALDSQNRIWSWGGNGYGNLARVTSGWSDSQPTMIQR